jgi:hypothetical protein
MPSREILPLVNLTFVAFIIRPNFIPSVINPQLKIGVKQLYKKTGEQQIFNIHLEPKTKGKIWKERHIGNGEH